MLPAACARAAQIVRYALLMLLGLAGETALADEKADRMMRLGRHLAQECTSCHRLDGASSGAIPNILGMHKDDFIATMQFYKTGARTNQAMVSVVQSLSAEEIEALAIFYGAQKKPPRR
ncbi:MAG: hypothetical protein KDJ41_04210 [Hyphomicrobiaceae bacterium]|nr:hypothetical protein [Hyphomicrobiaceae bacterium]